MTKDQLLCVRRWMCWRQKKGRQTFDFHFLCQDGHIRKIVCHKISHLIKQMDAKVWGALFLQVDALAAPQNRHLRNAQGRAGPLHDHVRGEGQLPQLHPHPWDRVGELPRRLGRLSEAGQGGRLELMLKRYPKMFSRVWLLHHLLLFTRLPSSGWWLPH